MTPKPLAVSIPLTTHTADRQLKSGGHRLSGDLELILLYGLIATASRRNLTDNFIACRAEPCFSSD